MLYLKSQEKFMLPGGKMEVYEIVKGVITIWNSFEDSVARALYLRPAIDEFV